MKLLEMWFLFPSAVMTFSLARRLWVNRWLPLAARPRHRASQMEAINHSQGEPFTLQQFKIAMQCNLFWTEKKGYPLGKRTYPTLGKETSSSKMPQGGRGVSSQEDIFHKAMVFCFKLLKRVFPLITSSVQRKMLQSSSDFLKYRYMWLYVNTCMIKIYSSKKKNKKKNNSKKNKNKKNKNKNKDKTKNKNKNKNKNKKRTKTRRRRRRRTPTTTTTRKKTTTRRTKTRRTKTKTRTRQRTRTRTRRITKKNKKRNNNNNNNNINNNNNNLTIVNYATRAVHFSDWNLFVERHESDIKCMLSFPTNSSSGYLNLLL